MTETTTCPPIPRAHQLIKGILLNGLDYGNTLEATVSFRAMDPHRWGMVRRYGDRNWHLIAELIDGRTVQVMARDNPYALDILKAKKALHRYWNPRPTGNQHNVTVDWL
jgi:hypothetical protein